MSNSRLGLYLASCNKFYKDAFNNCSAAVTLQLGGVCENVTLLLKNYFNQQYEIPWSMVASDP